MDPQPFREHVQSFEFWFEAVNGYLAGRSYGHRPETPETLMGPAEREALVTVLANYCVGELTALEGASGLIRVAPNQQSKIFLATQTADEARHLEVLVHRMRELGVEDPEDAIWSRASKPLLEFRLRLLEFVARGDWPAALFAQNVILESMEFASFQQHARNSDPRTHEVLMGIVKDERRHIGYGENELGRRLRDAPSIRARLVDVRNELDHLVLSSFEDTLDRVHARPDRRTDLGRSYLQAVERLGFA